ncbi:MAG TPA: saccharopine dehydrogenase NADP-binding domain-containing protein [Myxococcales bacterium]|nr:saccharopine dehydrogenase NADP-binding domain-containing protein [Myxococcales bacterium]
MDFMIYGAYGYTGELCAELAVAKGMRPLLAGRSAARLKAVADRLSLQARAFDLSKPDLRGVGLVLHCAGPFSQTSKAMVDACLAAQAHYLDVTGEVAVFESVLSRDAEAKARGIVLLPGVGFDVVPSDCLAATLKSKLPSATALELAFAPMGRSSPGTLKTSIESFPQGGLVRRDGRLTKVPAAFEVRTVPFHDKPRTAMTVPWGDLATAFRSTGIPNITVFMSAKPSVIRAARMSRLTGPLLGLPFVQRFLKRRIEQRVKGPDAGERARGKAEFWGRATDGGKSVELTMTVPEGYSLTAEAALECARRVMAGEVKPGAWTPSLAFGAGFAASLPGVRV